MADLKKAVDSTKQSIRQVMREKYTAEEKVRIVLEGLRGEITIVDLCRKEGINPNLYYKWRKEFLEGGKQRLEGFTQWEAGNLEVEGMQYEIEQLKKLVAKLTLRNKGTMKYLLGKVMQRDE